MEAMSERMEKSSMEKRTAVLEANIAVLQDDGWIVENRWSTSAHLVKPAKKYGYLMTILVDLFRLLVPREKFTSRLFGHGYRTDDLAPTGRFADLGASPYERGIR